MPARNDNVSGTLSAIFGSVKKEEKRKQRKLSFRELSREIPAPFWEKASTHSLAHFLPLKDIEPGCVDFLAPSAQLLGGIYEAFHPSFLRVYDGKERGCPTHSSQGKNRMQPFITFENR